MAGRRRPSARARCDAGPGGLNGPRGAPEKFRSDSPLRFENARTSLIRRYIVPLGASPNAMHIRSARVPSLLLVASLAAGNAWAQHDGERWRGHDRREGQQQTLSDSVRRFEKESGGGQVLSAERIPFDGRDVNRVKVVDSSGRVRVYMDDPQQRGRRDDERPTRRDDNNND